METKRYKRPWVQGDTISVGIGQGYWTATPLQVAKATSIVVNNGKIHTPHLMKSVEGATIEPYQDPLYMKILPILNKLIGTQLSEVCSMW